MDSQFPKTLQIPLRLLPRIKRYWDEQDALLPFQFKVESSGNLERNRSKKDVLVLHSESHFDFMDNHLDSLLSLTPSFNQGAKIQIIGWGGPYIACSSFLKHQLAGL